MIKTQDENAKINALKPYRNIACIYCGRKYPDTILNIQSHIQHNTGYRCVDIKKCKKFIDRLTVV